LERKHNNIAGPLALPVIRIPKGTKITVSSGSEKDAGLPIFQLMKPLARTVQRVQAVFMYHAMDACRGKAVTTQHR
jgi:hypothetical protein